MIPFRDNIPSRTTPFLTVLLIAVNGLAYVYESSLTLEARQRLVYRFGLIPAEFQYIGDGPKIIPVVRPQVIRQGQYAVVQPAVEEQRLEGTWAGAIVPMITSMFLHGSLWHLIGNMWFLWLFGDNVEDRLGRVRFLLLYFLSGLAAAGTQVLINWGDLTPMIGASGAVSGVLGAYMVTYPYARVLMLVPFFYFFWPVVELPAVVFLGFWIVMQFLQGATSLGTAGAGGVAWWAHIGGFLAGIALLWLLAPEPPGRRGPTWDELADER